jgi:arylsulfatase A-like enzyme
MTADSQHPNLLFVMTDHQRADSLGMVQAGVEVCPNVNLLAAGGASFTRAYNTCPLCVPARTALFTGLYPTRNGVVCNDWPGMTAGDHLTLQQCLSEAGYDVAHVGVHHVRVRPDLRERVPYALWLDNSSYADHARAAGLDSAQDLSGFRRSVLELQDGERVEVRYSSARAGVWPGPAEHFMDAWWCREAAHFIRERSHTGRPFALFLFLWAPHPPLRVPEPYASMFDPERIELPSNVDVPANAEPSGRRDGIAAQLAEGLSEGEWRRAWAAHLGLVRLADDGIGTVLAALGEAGFSDRTLAVFTVDHGEQLGQHRMYQKMEMYEQAVRVPLVFDGAGVSPGEFDAPVSHLDVLPTVLEMLDVACPEGLDGVSLASSLRAGESPPERAVFSEYAGNPTTGDQRRAVITRRFKYVYDPEDMAELYDLETDPLEMRNLAREPEHAETLRELHELCRRWHVDHGDGIDFDEGTAYA